MTETDITNKTAPGKKTGGGWSNKYFYHLCYLIVMALILLAVYIYSLDCRTKIAAGNAYGNYELFLNDDLHGEEPADELNTQFDNVRRGDDLQPTIKYLTELYDESASADSEIAYYRDDIAWNLAIAYLKTGDRKRARPLLQGIIDRNEKYEAQILPVRELMGEIY